MFLAGWLRELTLRQAAATLLVVAGALSGSLYAFGPVLLTHWLSSGDAPPPAPEQTSKALEQTNEAIRNNNLALQALTEALDRQKAEPVASAPPTRVNAETTLPAITQPRAIEPDVKRLIPGDEPAQQAAKPLQPTFVEPRPELPTAPAVLAADAASDSAPPARSSTRPKTFGVFEEEEFRLCGYQGFTARLTSKSTGEEVTIASEDRSIPDRTFRGYQRSLPPKEPVELWENCVVGVGYSSSNGIRQIVFSVVGKT